MGTLANLVQFVGLDAKMDLEIGSPSSVAKIDWNSSAQTSIPQQQVYEKFTFVIREPTIPKPKNHYFLDFFKKNFQRWSWEAELILLWKCTPCVCSAREKVLLVKVKVEKNIFAFEPILLWKCTSCVLDARERKYFWCRKWKWNWKWKWEAELILLNENALRVLYARCSREKVLLVVKVEKTYLRFCGEYYWTKSNCNNSNCWIVSWGFIVTNQITE